jgi:hypothetical protein
MKGSFDGAGTLFNQGISERESGEVFSCRCSANTQIRQRSFKLLNSGDWQILGALLVSPWAKEVFDFVGKSINWDVVCRVSQFNFRNRSHSHQPPVLSFASFEEEISHVWASRCPVWICNLWNGCSDNSVTYGMGVWPCHLICEWRSNHSSILSRVIQRKCLRRRKSYHFSNAARML